MRVKEYYEDFISLPPALKWTIYIAAALVLLVTIHQSVSNYAGNKKIERLEKMNRQLEAAAVRAQERAKSAEKNAADEAASRLDLEEKLKILETNTRKQDEQIISQSKKSNSLRGDLRRVRVSKPRNASTGELERRLCERYGCNQ